MNRARFTLEKFFQQILPFPRHLAQDFLNYSKCFMFWRSSNVEKPEENSKNRNRVIELGKAEGTIDGEPFSIETLDREQEIIWSRLRDANDRRCALVKFYWNFINLSVIVMQTIVEAYELWNLRRTSLLYCFIFGSKFPGMLLRIFCWIADN